MNNKKILFLTQKSYYLSIKKFYKFFASDNADVIYIKKKNLFLTTLKDLLKEFGFINSIKIVFKEIEYFLTYYFKEKKIKSVKIESPNLNRYIHKYLKSNQCDLIISIGCPVKIDIRRLKIYNVEIFNLHGGITPYQIGKFSAIKSIKKEDEYLGATLHSVTSKIDLGPIISQNYFKRLNNNYLDNYLIVLDKAQELLNNFYQNKNSNLPKNILNYFIKKY